MFYPQYEVLNHIMAKGPTSSNSEKSQHRTDAVRLKRHRILQGVMLWGVRAWHSCWMGNERRVWSIFLVDRGPQAYKTAQMSPCIC